MGFRLQQTLMTLNDFERHFTALTSAVCMFLSVRLESRGFRYKVALYLSYLQFLHIMFDHKTKGNTFEF